MQFSSCLYFVSRMSEWCADQELSFRTSRVFSYSININEKIYVLDICSFCFFLVLSFLLFFLFSLAKVEMVCSSLIFVPNITNFRYFSIRKSAKITKIQLLAFHRCRYQVVSILYSECRNGVPSWIFVPHITNFR